MNEFSLLPDDPKLTAYALGELEGDERAAMEAALRRDPAARAAVEEIRAVAAQLEAALAAEAEPEIEPFAPRVVIAPEDAYRVNGHGPVRKIIRFPQVYYVIGGLAAACFAVLVALREPTPTRPADKPHYIELTSPADSTSSTPADATARNDTNPINRIAPDPSVTPLLDRKKPFPGGGEETDRGPSPDLAEASKSVTFSTVPAPIVTPATNVPVEPRRDVDVPPNSVATSAPGPSQTQMSDEKSASGNQPVFAPTPEKSLLPSESKTALTGGGPGSVSGSSRTPASASEVIHFTVPPKPVDNDLVTLDTVVVSADPLSFNFATDALRTNSDGKRDPRLLPRAPLGAKFGRNAEIQDYTPDNDFVSATENPVSTYPIAVDTASYASVRRLIESGALPARSAVRIEELLNYFPYQYPAPKNDTAFAASLEVSAAPWALTHRLVRIGLKGRDVGTASRPVANLVFLVDLSAAMGAPDRLPLIKDSLRAFVDGLRPDDHIAIVACASTSRVALPSTPVAKSAEIFAALDSLIAGGPGNGGVGFLLAYDAAKAGFETGGINRVILCTSANFNSGSATEADLTRLVEERANSGVFLTVFGFGAGSRKDVTLEKLTLRGNGQYGFIDTRREAGKQLVAQVSGPAKAIAKEVEIRVEFNPAKVSSYRLIGYENRLLKKDDFNNDKVDAGEIDAGHMTTALYEIVPVGAEEKRPGRAPPIEGLKYQRREMAKPGLAWGATEPPPPSKELLTVEVSYKKPNDWMSKSKAEFSLTDPGRQFADATADFKFAAAVAEFGMILRESPHKGAGTMGDVLAWAAAGARSGDDPHGYRREFLGLARRAQTLLR